MPLTCHTFLATSQRSATFPEAFGEVDDKLADRIPDLTGPTLRRQETQILRHYQTGQSLVPGQRFIRFTEAGTVTTQSELRRPQCDLLREVFKRRMQ